MRDELAEAVLDEFNFGDGVVNAGDKDARRMAREIVNLRILLAFADGYVVSNSAFEFTLADLYAEDCKWAQETIARAGCHERGKFMSKDEA